MVSFTPETVLTILVSCQLIEATVFSGREEPQDHAEDRIFKGKKKNLLSLLSRPQVFHTLSPIDQYPIWKVHKYRGIEFRPVQIVDLPTPFDYSPVQPEYGLPPVHVPHTEYGLPEYTTGVTKPVEPIEVVQLETSHHHGGKLKTLLGLLKFNRGLFKTLKNFKSWKHGIISGWTVPEVSFKELPTLPQEHGSAISSGPYVKFQTATPVSFHGYQPQYIPQYIPHYEYQYPPYPSNEYSSPVRAPAPYYGAPPLFDSYGSPLPPDAYSSAPSDQVPSFALPENPSQSERQDHFPQNEEEYNFNNNTLKVAETEPKVGELPKFLSEEKESSEETTKLVDQYNSSNDNNNQ